MKRMILLYTIIIVALQLIAGCSKNWLDERSDKSIVVPSTLDDLSALLDNTMVTTGDQYGGVLPVLGEVGSDLYYLSDETWSNLSRIADKNAYVWNKDIFEGTTSYDWNSSYIKIYYTNVVLEGLNKVSINDANVTEYNNVKGRALFLRGEAFFHLAQVFVLPYDEQHLDQLGLPLRLSADFNITTKRSTMAETYVQILNDLHAAYSLLPEEPKYRTRASKAAVDGLLARIYLVMGKYEEAERHAKNCLSRKGELLDFNSLDTAAVLPISLFNKEVIYHSSLGTSIALDNHFILQQFYQSYSDNDLRKRIYFTTAKKRISFRGSYSQSDRIFFSGIAVDEIYLIYAECLARLGKKEEAIKKLNRLMYARFDKIAGISTYEEKSFNTIEDLLETIIEERKKELVFRGLRWMDLRRLNKMGAGITLSRNVKGVHYTLAPNSLRYAYPIPDEVIAATGIPQNER